MLDQWKGMSYGERLQAVRDYVRDQAESWGADRPSVVVGKAVDEDGNEHYAMYDRDLDTITIDPELLRDPDLHPGEEVLNSVTHEFRHAMQDQFDEESEEEEDFMEGEERESDADDFADAYSEYLEDECGEPDPTESVPGSDVGDWSLPAEPAGGALA